MAMPYITLGQKPVVPKPVVPQKPQLNPEQFSSNQKYTNALRTSGQQNQMQGQPVGATPPKFMPTQQSPASNIIPPPNQNVQNTQGQNAYNNLKQQQNATAPSTPNLPSTPTQGAGKLANGTFDPNYVPQSEQEAAQPGLDKYTANKWLANYYKSKGLNFDSSKMAGNFEEEAGKFLDQQESQKTLLDKQIDNAKKNAQDNLQQSAAATNAQFAVNREGIQSQGNQMIPGQVNAAAKSNFDVQMSGLDNQLKQLDQQLQDNQTNFVAGREEQIRSQVQALNTQKMQLQQQEDQKQASSQNLLSLLQRDNSLANMSPEDQQALQSHLAGLPPGVVNALSNSATRNVMNQSQQQQFDKQTSAIGTLKGLVTSGIELTPQMISSMSKQTGLPAEALLDFNTQAQAVMKTKGLDDAQRAQQIQDLGYTLDQKARGIFNQAEENSSHLAQMYKDGASQEDITNFKNAAGIKDYNDPLYQAQVAYQQSQALIEQKHANGEVVTVQDQATFLDNQQKLQDLGYDTETGTHSGTGSVASAYVPSAPKLGIKINFNNGKFSVQAPPNMQFQCGAFVNRCWGLDSAGNQGLGSTSADKRRVVNQRGVTVKEAVKNPNLVQPGMAFVMPIHGKFEGVWHTGLVGSVDVEHGTFTTIEANANGRATTAGAGPGKSNITSRVMPISQMYGFVPPPDGKSQRVGGPPAQQEGGSYNKYLDEARSQGLPSKEAKAYASQKTLSELNQPTETQGGDYNKFLQEAKDQGMPDKEAAAYASKQTEASLTAGTGGASSTKMTSSDIDAAAKELLDGKSFPSGRFKQQILNKAAELDTSGNFDATQAEANWKSRTSNAADFQKVTLNAQSSSKLIDQMIKDQADAYQKSTGGLGVSQALGLFGESGRAAGNALSENFGSTAFSGLKSKLSELSGQIGQVASSGGATHAEQLNSILKSIDFNQTPEQFAASLQGLKDVMDTKVQEMKATNKAPQFGTYEGQNDNESVSDEGDSGDTSNSGGDIVSTIGNLFGGGNKPTPQPHSEGLSNIFSKYGVKATSNSSSYLSKYNLH